MMSIYQVGLLVRLDIRAANQTDAEEKLALLVVALEKLGGEVDIEEFDLVAKATERKAG